MFKGVMTAVITPFVDGRIDESALRKLIDWQIAEGIDAIVPCGTTGEAATLSYEEQDRAVRVAVEQAAGRVPVIAGAGSNSTSNAIKLARQVKAAGADAMLQVTPFYNKPTQEGLHQHFRAIAEVVDLPMVLYNVPGRTAVNILPETVARLAKIDSIVGVKEASGRIEQIREVLRLTPDGFAVLSGDDGLNFEVYRAGGAGAISVVSNVAPKLVSAVWDAFDAGRADEASQMQRDLDLLNKAMFIETNPIPAKTSLAMMGRCAEEFRLPMTPISEEHRAELKDILVKYGIL
ncbi:MAG: 4-hydroxy-tetrahydrodipicolinate synthase [Proteobacteria bacterium]|nr:4-hydroxy-tetrahydrodipicolinate synthase [Pseudomonadota bacterium]